MSGILKPAREVEEDDGEGAVRLAAEEAVGWSKRPEAAEEGRGGCA